MAATGPKIFTICPLQKRFTKLLYYIILYIYLFICLSLAVLRLRCYTGFSGVAVSGGCSLVAVQGLLIVVASLVAEPGCRTHGL